MGAKTGFAAVILAALGLRSGQGADAYVFAESDPDVRALLRAYPDADMLRRIADIIRGWKDEEPRALWERLRAERRARNAQATHDVAYEDAGWIVTNGWAAHGKDAEYYGGPDRPRANSDQPTAITIDGLSDRCHRLAEYAHITASSRLGTGGFSATCRGNDGIPNDPRRPVTPTEVASGFERVAEWTWLSSHAYRKGDIESGWQGADSSKEEGCRNLTMTLVAQHRNLAASRWPPVAVLATLPDAAELSALLGTPGDLDGVVVYSDPDYRGTTGYLSTCREVIPALARGWSDAGAVVCISEAEPLPELPGWFATEISAGRRGQKRTFSKQQAEWLTMNREPAHRVATQQRMFGG